MCDPVAAQTAEPSPEAYRSWLLTERNKRYHFIQQRSLPPLHARFQWMADFNSPVRPKSSILWGADTWNDWILHQDIDVPHAALEKAHQGGNRFEDKNGTLWNVFSESEMDGVTGKIDYNDFTWWTVLDGNLTSHRHAPAYSAPSSARRSVPGSIPGPSGSGGNPCLWATPTHPTSGGPSARTSPWVGEDPAPPPYPPPSESQRVSQLGPKVGESSSGASTPGAKLRPPPKAGHNAMKAPPPNAGQAPGPWSSGRAWGGDSTRRVSSPPPPVGHHTPPPPSIPAAWNTVPTRPPVTRIDGAKGPQQGQELT